MHILINIFEKKNKTKQTHKWKNRVVVGVMLTQILVVK